MIALTFDTDWMTSASMRQFLNETEIPGKATFFLHDVYQDVNFGEHELGPHPTIVECNDWTSDLERLSSQILSRSRGCRPHSCVYSHMIGLELHKRGFEYVSQQSQLFQKGNKPFRHPWGIWELPIYYMDNMDYCFGENWTDVNHHPFNEEILNNSLCNDGLYVYAFHPLHIALNTISFDDYSQKKQKLQMGINPYDIEGDGFGVRDFYKLLCKKMKDADVVSVTAYEALRSHRIG